MDAPNDQSSFLREQSCIDGKSSVEQEVSDKKYHRLTPNEIHELDTFYKDCPCPDENKRAALSRKLGLEVKRLKFWFQNKRNQLKVQSERDENKLLKQQNENLKAENELLKQAYANPICHSCGATALPPASVSFALEQLRTENAQLKRELRHICDVSDKLLNKSAASSSASHLASNGKS